MSTAEPTTQIEITVPSGAFARIRRVRLLDQLAAEVVSTSPKTRELVEAQIGESLAGISLFLPALISAVVTIDDARVTVADVLAMDIRDSSAIGNALAPFLVGPIR